MGWKAEAQRLEAKLLHEREVVMRLQAILKEQGIDIDPEQLPAPSGVGGGAVPLPEHALDQGLEEYMAKMTAVLEAGQKVDSVEIRFQDMGFEATVEVVDSSQAITTVGNLLKRLPCVGGPAQKETRQLLQGWTGVIKPETMTLVLGPPGSGKSLLLKSLAGRVVETPTRKKLGTVTYDGLTIDKFVGPRIMCYVNQLDNHLPTLTVKETFDFSAACLVDGVGRFMQASGGDGPTEQQKADIAKMLEQKNDVMMQVLGLKRVQDTIVGNNLLRGVSGGERKRVTSGEMLAGMMQAWFLDEISTGLDSSATFDICRSLKTAAKALHGSIVMSLLQPPPEVYALFDNVIVLAEGRCVYNGPREELMPYFNSIGFECPPRKDVADFLQEVTTELGASFVRQGAENVPTTAAEFEARFRETEIHARALAALAEPQPEPTWLRYSQKEFAHGWLESLKQLWRRQVTLNSRDKIFVYGRFAQAVFMSIVVGTLFYDLEIDSFQARFGCFFFSAILLSMNSMAAMPVIIDARNIYYKQRRANFFPTSAYVLSESLANVPLAALEVSLYSIILYYLVGFTTSDNGEHLFVFLAVGFCLSLCMSQLFKTIASVMPDAASAQPVAGIVMVMCVLFSGFIAAPDVIPDGWIWVYYISPLAWAMRAYSINEFRSSEYMDATFGNGESKGLTYLEAYGYDDADTNKSSYIGVCAAVLLVEYLVLLAVNTACLYFIRHDHGGQSRVTADVQSDLELTDMAASKQPVALNQVQDVLEADSPDDVDTPTPLKFEKVTLSFRDMSYTVDLPRKSRFAAPEQLPLLNDISGYCKPGTMTALMGSSGAGKTTLMDVLAGRKTGGYITGEVLVNGFPKDAATFNRMAGYVEQNDIQSPTSTVREALEFSANLRLSADTTDVQRRESVDQTLQLLELDNIQHRVIGLPGAAGALSTEQRKRVTIGVELVANPSVLFLDEPTSGLDARAASIVMRVLRRIAGTGRSIVCTIHQPSAFLFQMFDSLLLLKRGGHTVYFGPLGDEASQLIQYLEAIEGTPAIPDGVNPATWMLDVIGAGMSASANDNLDYSAVYKHSALKSVNDEELARVMQPGAEVKFDSTYARSTLAQLYFCGRKAQVNLWRTPSYSATRMVINAAIALIFGSVYWDQQYSTSSDLLSRVGVIFIVAIFLGFVNSMTVLPVLSAERTVFYREKAIHMYAPMPYAIAYGMAEIPYLIVSSGIFVNVFYWVVGLANDTEAYLYFWAIFFLYTAGATFFGQLLVFGTPNEQVAQICAAGAAALYCLFSGYLIPTNDVPEFWKFMLTLCPTKWALQGLVVTQFHGDTTPIHTAWGTDTDAETFVSDLFPDFHYEDKETCLWALFAFVMFFRVTTCLCMRNVNFLNR